MKLHCRVLVLAAILVGNVSAQAENLGRLQVEDLVLRPRFDLVEPANANFTLGESMASLSWVMDPGVRAVISIGPENLIGKPVHFSPSTTDRVAMIEAFAEYASPFGMWRAGLQPVSLGIDGRRSEADLWLTRGFLYQQRWAGIRDLGLSYEIANGGFFTRVLVHNGEGDANVDGRPFYTALWAYQVPERLEFGFSGQTGTTKPIATSPSGDTLAGVDVNREARWRLAGPFIAWTPRRWRVELEGFFGELEQGRRLSGYSQARLQIEHTASEKFQWAFRAEHADPNHKVDGDQVREISLGLAMSSHFQTSRVWLIGTKVLEESGQRPNDRLQLIWHVAP